MNYEEAVEWLQGLRSEWNTFAGSVEGHVLCAQADAARTEQAYWIVRAHKEALGLLPKIEEGSEGPKETYEATVNWDERAGGSGSGW